MRTAFALQQGRRRPVLVPGHEDGRDHRRKLSKDVCVGSVAVEAARLGQLHDVPLLVGLLQQDVFERDEQERRRAPAVCEGRAGLRMVRRAETSAGRGERQGEGVQ